jgi:hypothetical protein
MNRIAYRHLLIADRRHGERHALEGMKRMSGNRRRSMTQVVKEKSMAMNFPRRLPTPRGVKGAQEPGENAQAARDRSRSARERADREVRGRRALPSTLIAAGR